MTKTASRSSVSSSVGGLSSPTEDPQRSFVDPALPTEHGYTTQPAHPPTLPRRDSQGTIYPEKQIFSYHFFF